MLCAFCNRKICQNPKPYCERCGRSIDNSGALCAECRKTKLHFSAARSAYIYDGALKEVIRAFKYKGKLTLGAGLARLLMDFIKENEDMILGIDAITFVPLQNGRMRERGFNQSKALASRIAEEIKIHCPDLLEKIRSTKNQNELSRDGRLCNLRGAFRIRRGSDIKGLRILLVDDVMTTGSTLSECSKTLFDAGAAEVRCLTLARGL